MAAALYYYPEDMIPLCNIPEHQILHRIEKTVGGIAKDQQSLIDEVFGRENKPGLSAKVDALTAGNKKESVLVSLITSIVVALSAVFGINSTQ